MVDKLTANIRRCSVECDQNSELPPVWISTTELKGKTWFRINPVNFRTRAEHMEQLLALVEQECRVVLQSAGTTE